MAEPTPSPATDPPAGGLTLSAIESGRILIVDDNRVNRHLLMALLERGGFRNVAMAEDGREALERLPQFNPDLILLDLMMPNLDGFEACKQLRADPRYKDLPVLVQSSLSRAEDRARAFEAGATDYVTKPINAVELLSRVKIHLENRALVSNLQLYRQRAETELTLARQMQERLLPTTAQAMQVEADLGIRVCSHFAPSSELGGDYWEMRPDGKGRLVVWLVDFSGHGVGAALNTFRLHAILKPYEVEDFDPAQFLNGVNQRLCPLLPIGQYATILAGVIDPAAGCFFYASAGSTKPMLWAPGDTTPNLGDSSGLPCGIMAQATYENREMAMPAGSRLFLYSDAAIELPISETAVLDEEGLTALVSEYMAEADDGSFLGRLLTSLEARGQFDDDLTAVLISRQR
ncbi:MAG TPA: SpoIIE family protein phosphatase [Azospirillaceae bacterium]|nr:SpoIIE family protein phosphatase [Azospirillaceae bacterium]